MALVAECQSSKSSVIPLGYPGAPNLLSLETPFTLLKITVPTFDRKLICY